MKLPPIQKALTLEETMHADLLEVRLEHLEEDCAGQSQLMREWGFHKAKAIRAVKDLKKELKLKAAHVGRDVRTNPAEFGLEKATEKAVEEVCLLDADYQDLQDQLIQAEYEEDLLGAFVDAIKDRRDQLRNEVILFGQMYFSKPDTSGKVENSNPAAQLALSRKAAESLEDYDLEVPTRKTKPKK